MTKQSAKTAHWISGAALVGLVATACNPSPHIDPSTAAATGATAGTGGGTGGTMTTSEGGGGTAGTSTSTGGSAPTGCASNADCSFPTNLCDAPSGQCVECLVTKDCVDKQHTVCSKAACVCPTAGQEFCDADGYGGARCSDFTSSGKDCGSCGHECFGSCGAGKCVDAWEPTAKMGAPSARAYHVAVWTGSLMLVWGGRGSGGVLGDGAMYDPDKRTWTPMSNANAPLARDFATAVWADTKMIVWGGRDKSGNPLGDGATFDPTTNSWSNLPADASPSARYQHSAVWAGGGIKRMMVWGGFDASAELATGAYYTVADNLWHNLDAGSPPTQRRQHTAVWDDAKGRMIVFGGYGFDNGSGMTMSLNTGGIYGPLPDNETWTDLSLVGTPPAPRYEHSAVWASTHMIVWGGYNGALLDDGARFDAAGNSEWSPMNGIAPSARRRHSAVYFKALNKMVVWGGYGTNDVVLDDGGVFDVAGVQWESTGLPKGPNASVDHTAVVASSRMIVWGGVAKGGGYTDQGAVLDMTKVP